MPALLRALRPAVTRTRYYSSLPSTSQAQVSETTESDDLQKKLDAELQKQLEARKRKTEWKRRQGGQTFVDRLIVNVRAGKGGDGCVAFHREKFVRVGPPSGGNGGRGGDVYIQATPHLTSLGAVSRRVRGAAGANGMGTWQNGKNGAPLVIKVPLGTVVRELTGDDARRQPDEWEAEAEGYAGLDQDARRARWRELRWMHYPSYTDENVERAAFRDAEWELFKAERAMRAARRERAAQPLLLDLDRLEETEVPVDAPLALGKSENYGHLVASGGAGGYGNPHFLSTNNRSPKFATRGYEGERVTLELELKLVADVGFVGMPNAGKSTLLRALTGGRAKSEVASYAFTTLNPFVGVVRAADDGSIVGAEGEDMVFDETRVEAQREKEMMQSGAYADAKTRNQAVLQKANESDEDRPVEAFRFTVADNPGLIEQASEDVGLGHSFLRSMERSLALVYVVDFSEPEPWEHLRILREELEKYKPGMSKQARMVIANKADLLGADGAEEEQAAREKLQKLQDFVRAELDTEARTLDVVPTSGKFNQNLKKVVRLMRGYIEEERRHGSNSEHS
ncbi:GTPase [Dentipellis sp. KUC8613]|nr:GTPase [Dentipellis sp. KUC8613]